MTMRSLPFLLIAGFVLVLMAGEADAETSDDFNEVDLYFYGDLDEGDGNITTLAPTSDEDTESDCPQDINRLSWPGQDRQWGEVGSWKMSLQTPGEIVSGDYTFTIWTNSTQGTVEDVQFRITIYIGDSDGVTVTSQSKTITDSSGVATRFDINFDITNASFSTGSSIQIDLEYSGGDPGENSTTGGNSTEQIIILTSSVEHPAGISDFSIIYIKNIPPTILNLMFDEIINEGDISSFNIQYDDASDEVKVTWTFPDEIVEGDFVQYKFTDDGEFIVLITVSDEDGGESSEQIMVTVENVAPIFTEFVMPSTALKGEALDFYVSASDPGDDTITYSFDFGDGTSSLITLDGGNVTHKFANGGSYTIVICAKDEDGGETCREQILPVISVEFPVALANDIDWNDEAPKNEVKPGDEVTFKGGGNDEDGEIVLYEWDFNGDGEFDWSSDETGSTTFVYNNEGTYTAVLRVTDNDGFTATDERTITVGKVVEDAEEDEEGIPAPSIIASIAAIGIIALRRRY